MNPSKTIASLCINKGIKKFPSIFLVALIPFLFFTNAHGAPKDSAKPGYTLGVFPHLPPARLEAVFSPMAKRFSEVLGRDVKLGTSSTYQKFMDKLNEQKFDIAFVQPFDYVMIADNYGYTPLAVRDEPLRAIFVVKADSKIKSIQDLKGKTISLPPKVSAVSHLTKGHLKDNGLVVGKDVELAHFKSHVSCMKQVLIGKADACGTAAPALRFFQHKMKVKMNVVAETRAIPHTLFAIHPRVPKEEREKVFEEIFSWPNTDAGKKILSTGKLKPFVTIKDSAYDPVREFFKK